MGLFDRTRMCLECRGLGKRVVHHSKSYRETSHCYACDGSGRVRLLADGRPEPGFGWGVGTSLPPPARIDVLKPPACE